MVEEVVASQAVGFTVPAIVPAVTDFHQEPEVAVIQEEVVEEREPGLFF